jgi:hypothetical protein
MSITTAKIQVLPASTDNGTFYLTGQPISAGLTSSQYAFTGLTYNPSLNLLSLGGLIENYTTATVNINTNSVVFDFNKSTIFVVSGLTSNITANFVNVALTAGEIISTSIINIQGNVPYIPTVLTINGANNQIKWSGGTVPSGSNNKTDLINFTIICTNPSAYTVLGLLSSFA